MPTARPNWTRLEPQPRDPTGIAVGLRAEVHDPLWLLVRQRQTGALRGEDNGSPVRVRLEGEATRLTRYQQGEPGGAPGAPWEAREPLETLVEAEAEGEQPLRFAATAGLRFLALLDAAGAGGYAEAYREHYRLTTAASTPAARRFLGIMAGRAPDGIALYKDLVRAPGALPAEPPIAPGGDTEAVLAASLEFRAWYAALAGPERPSPWQPERFEYAFAVAAPLSTGEVVLTAREYDQGALDWDAFELAPAGTTLGANADAGATAPLFRDGVPTPVAYRGMPVARFWQYENADVEFGDLSAPSEDLTRLLLVEFGLVYGNDHFVVPIDIDVGSIARVDRLFVTDTFGAVVEVPHAAAADAAAGRPGTFRLFELGAGAARSPLFLLPPALGPSLGGRAIEEVRLLRDEGANLAWAVEVTAAADEGFPVERAGVPRAQPLAGASEVGAERAWRYRLRTPVADQWLPLVPIADRPGVNHLELGSLPALDGAPAPAAWGRILAELAGRAIPEEEIARAATSVTRAWQYARWTDGRQHAWVGRRRAPVAVAEDVGLRFDWLQEPSGGAQRVAPGGNDARFVSQSGPATMLAGEDYDVTVTMRNDGTATWSPEAGYWLGLVHPRAKPTWGVGRVALPRPVAPAAAAAFRVRVRPAAPAGAEALQWRMHQEGAGWFGDDTPPVSASVLPAGPNLVHNPEFALARPVAPPPVTDLGTGGPAAAEDWSLWNNALATTRSELRPSTRDGGSGRMLHVVTTGGHCGLVQAYQDMDTGPAAAMTSAWVYVVRGRVGAGSGNGGNTGIDVTSTTQGQWERLEMRAGRTPVNEVIVYAADDGGAEFFVDLVSVREIPPAS